jgi:DNA polymerase elongation subunit (family B)
VKLLLVDIETAPNIAHVWGLWDQSVSLSQLMASGYVMCWSAKWLGNDEVFFSSLNEARPKKMLAKIHDLLCEADAVVSWNGASFDIPHLNREFLEHDMTPPSPYAQIDLFLVAKKQFKFISNKLEYVAKHLGIGEKIKNEGHGLWVKCLNGDKAAWEKMKLYNMTDTTLLEGLYNKFQPWIPNHPHTGLRDDLPNGCPNCGSERLQARGWAFTRQGKYRRFQCRSCGAWTRSGKRVMIASQNQVALG